MKIAVGGDVSIMLFLSQIIKLPQAVHRRSSNKSIWNKAVIVSSTSGERAVPSPVAQKQPCRNVVGASVVSIMLCLRPCQMRTIDRNTRYTLALHTNAGQVVTVAIVV